MKRELLALSIASACISGCTHFSVANFEKDDASGVTGNRVGLLLIRDGWDRTYDAQPIAGYVSSNQELQKAIQSGCKSDRIEPKAVPAAIPILASLGKLGFDLFIDAQVRSAEELKKAAQATYSEKIALSSAQLRATNCALVVRYSDDKKSIGLVTLVKLDNKNDLAFVTRPLYVAASNAAAVTMKQTVPTINLSIAASAKGIAKQESGSPGLFSSGEGVFSVKNIVVNSSKFYTCPTESDCPKSDLIPYPEGDPVSITFSVTETGKIGVDIDQDVAELKAIKEAIGPAIKDSLKEKLK